MINPDDPFSFAPPARLAEEFLAIRRRLREDADIRSILVTSALAGEGKSFFAFHLALSLAGDRPVALVDGDWHGHGLADRLGTAVAPGLADLLADDTLALEPMLRPTACEGLCFLPPGRPPRAGAAARRLGRRLDELARRGDGRTMTIVDTPAVLSNSEAIAWTKDVNLTIVVVECNRTPRHLLERTLSLVQDCAKVECVINMENSGVFGLKGYG